MSARFYAVVALTITAIVASALPVAAWTQDDKSGPAAKKSDKPKKDKKKDKGESAPALAFKLKDIDEKEQDLRQYAGKVVLVVNVASKCGFTPQYKGLEKLYETHKDKGLVILGIPANDFGNQEPGSNTEIKEFCTTKYQVTFPMFAKATVKGADICPLYKYLTSKKSGHKFGGAIQWNFNKFLISRKGEVIGRFDSRVTPDAKTFVEAVEKALSESSEQAEATPKKTKAKKVKPKISG